MSDEGVNVDNGHGHHVTKLRGNSLITVMYAVEAVVESSLKLRHFFKPRARSLCVMAVPATG